MRRKKSEVRVQNSEGSGAEAERRIAVYPGSFDPITLGHLDVVKRATHLFDKVVVGVASRQEKHPLFSWSERIRLAKEVVKGMDGVTVQGFECLLVDFARQERAQAIIRGLRAVSDFENEFQMALMNRRLTHDIETVFLMPALSWVYLSSTIVKDVAKNHGDVSGLVPEHVAAALKKKFGG